MDESVCTAVHSLSYFEIILKAKASFRSSLEFYFSIVKGKWGKGKPSIHKSQGTQLPLNSKEWVQLGHTHVHASLFYGSPICSKQWSSYLMMLGRNKTRNSDRPFIPLAYEDRLKVNKRELRRYYECRVE
jgi:hypothetical protein